MKKLFFSAVALVAFSSVSMGNTSVASNSLSDSNTEITKSIFIEDNCIDFAIGELALLDPDSTLNPVDSYHYYQAMYGICYHARSLFIG